MERPEGRDRGEGEVRGGRLFSDEFRSYPPQIIVPCIFLD